MIRVSSLVASARQRLGTMRLSETIFSATQLLAMPTSRGTPFVTPNSYAACSQQSAHVYVLELQKGYIYVGKSKNIKGRLKQHVNGKGAVFTREYKPTGKLLPRLGTLRGDGDGPERDETLRQMYALTPQKVRGWKYCNKSLSMPDLREIESNIRELFDLCRRCGRTGHFARGCREKTDRFQKNIVGARRAETNTIVMREIVQSAIFTRTKTKRKCADSVKKYHEKKVRK